MSPPSDRRARGAATERRRSPCAYRRLLAAIAARAVPAAVPALASAQAVEVAVAGGIAVPTGAYAETRTHGPLVRATVTVGDPARLVRWRGEMEGAWLLDQVDGATAGLGTSQQGTLRAASVLLSVVLGPDRGGFSPYLTAGAGLQRLRVEGAQNPYGKTAGVRAGGGARVRAGRATLHAEVTSHWALTDFGTGRDFGLGSYVPAVVGLSLRF